MSTHIFDILLLPGPRGEKSVWVFPFLWGEHERWGGWRGSCWGQGPCCEVLNNIRSSKPFLFLLVVDECGLSRKFSLWVQSLFSKVCVVLLDHFKIQPVCIISLKDMLALEIVLCSRHTFWNSIKKGFIPTTLMYNCVHLRDVLLRKNAFFWICPNYRSLWPENRFFQINT